MPRDEAHIRICLNDRVSTSSSLGIGGHSVLVKSEKKQPAVALLSQVERHECG